MELHIILNNYMYWINLIICGSNSCLSEAASSIFELALVQFNSHGSYSCTVFGTTELLGKKCGLEWLSCMNFSGGGFYDVAIAEGLTEVVMSTEVVQRHCILVAASNPCPFPTVYWPPNKREMQLVSHLSDAETVAKSFPQSCVSLSVICPKQLPMLKAIYNAGKRNPSATTTTIDVIKNPNYLILISEDFLEARVALSPSVRTMNEYRPTRQPVLAGNIALAAVKEPSVVSSVASNTPQAGRPKYGRYGKLDGKRHGQTVMITRLEAYRRSSSAEPLVEDWPSTLLIDRLVSQDHMHTKHYTGKCEFIVFRAMHQHGFLGQMLEKKLVSHLEPSP
ncbi:putative mediator complex, subunit Med25, von Willebrand factor type A [Helianthus annuus]|nr:putative mediator complex, subunit Med25, von Willebrand factor type A [Helianthus annuus]